MADVGYGRAGVGRWFGPAHRFGVPVSTGRRSRSRRPRELDRELSYSFRYSRAGALLTLDIDTFRPTNDTYGRAAADVTLKAVSGMLRPPVVPRLI